MAQNHEILCRGAMLRWQPGIEEVVANGTMDEPYNGCCVRDHFHQSLRGVNYEILIVCRAQFKSVPVQKDIL